MKLYKIKKSKIDKNGLYANCNIKSGTRIIEYKGKIISVKQSENDPKFDNSKAIYLFNLNKRYDLDGAYNFNIARLINHSCNPNCEVFGKGLKVWVYAMKNIKKVKSYLMITVLVLTKILGNFHAIVDQRTVLDILCEKDPDGESKN